MIDRSIPLLAAALACLSAPALAQDTPAAAPPLPSLDAIEPAPPAIETSAAEPSPEPAPVAAPASQPAGPPERTAWLDQCRASRPAGARVASIAGQPDLCESYLQQYERYATAAQGAAPDGRSHLPGPVMWASVPILRQPVAPEGEN